MSAPDCYRDENVLPTYVEPIDNDVKLDKPLNIAVDCGSCLDVGAAVLVLQKPGQQQK